MIWFRVYNTITCTVLLSQNKEIRVLHVRSLGITKE